MGERLTQAGIEALISGSPKVRSTRTGIEGVIFGSPNVRLTQVGIEVISPYTPPPSGPAVFLTTVFPAAVRGLTWTAMREFSFDTTAPSSPNKLEVRIPNTQNPIWTWTLVYEYLKNDANDIQSIFSPYTDLQTFIGFLLARQGQYDDFLFYDPSFDMNVAGPAIWQPVPVLQTGNYCDTETTIIDPAGHLQTASTGGLSGRTIPSFNDSGGTTTDGNVVWQDGGAFNGATAQPLQFLSTAGIYYSPIQRNYGGQFYEDVTDLNTSVYPLRVWANGVLIQNTAYQILGPGLSLPIARYYGAYVRFNPWMPFISYFAGNVIIDPAGHLQQATTNGATGPLQPAWNDSGGTTIDGSVVWQDAGPVTTITASFNYYWRCRFARDTQDYEQFTKFLFTIGGQKMKNGTGMLKLMTVRAPTLSTAPACEVYPWNL